ncbi:NMDA receptor synaptonuclear signaling and neuronal migration factor-like [Cavia porcellus]|uniref:NMDA receptor synaptonuclear signaling and neuronal migration factor-like n=1 Tax=Cavia porcellus TaxID=10141 RepID=UPI002FDFE6C8
MGVGVEVGDLQTYSFCEAGAEYLPLAPKRSNHSLLQGGPGHLYLLKNKVATFAKVEKEEDMIHFWKRLSRLMSKVNPEPNVVHIMGCYILGNPNGEKLFQNLRNLMTPYRVAFESPLELSAQGKQMIETYFDFRLYRLWKSRQHSKLLDLDEVL